MSHDHPGDRCALLQVALEQSIDRESLERASVVAPALALADCARLARELCGVVVANLPCDQARALQTALMDLGHPTELVPHAALAQLPLPSRLRAVAFEHGALVVTDRLGRTLGYEPEGVLVAAVGLVTSRASRGAPTLSLEFQDVDEGVSQLRLEPVFAPGKPTRRLYVEFVFRGGPVRVRGVVSDEESLLIDGARVRPANLAPARRFTEQLRAWLPRERVGRGVRHGWEAEAAIYPGEAAFAEELQWLLYQQREDGPPGAPSDPAT